MKTFKQLLKDEIATYSHEAHVYSVNPDVLAEILIKMGAKVEDLVDKE